MIISPSYHCYVPTSVEFIGQATPQFSSQDLQPTQISNKIEDPE